MRMVFIRHEVVGSIVLLPVNCLIVTVSGFDSGEGAAGGIRWPVFKPDCRHHVEHAITSCKEVMSMHHDLATSEYNRWLAYLEKVCLPKLVEPS